MKIGYFADGPWSHLALERINADSRFHVAFIVPRFDTPDPVLGDYARRFGIDFIKLEDVNSPGSIARLQTYGADLFVSMSYNQIFREAVISLPPQGVINCHAGALPFYRGRNILNWALINDAKSFGVTAHFVNPGIDTGDIIIQRLLPISDQDDYRTLLERAIEACPDVLVEALDRISGNTVQRIRQSSIHPVGTYFGRRQPGDEWIDWNWSSRRIFNFIRAIAPPGPAARTTRGDELVSIHASEEIENAIPYIATPGEVVGRTPRGPIVKTGDSTLLLTDWRADSTVPMRVGTRLGSNPMDTLSAITRMQQRIDALERKLSELASIPIVKRSTTP